MSEVAEKIIQSAEKRMRAGGFRSFSFGDISKDVGVKTSSIHYYFPTKEDLSVEVIRRYSANVAERFDAELAKGGDPVAIWIKGFRGTITSRDHICPCTVLGAGTLDLPEEVAVEVKKFFQMHLDKLKGAGLSEDRANEVLTTLAGAQVMALVFNDVAIFDSATKSLTEASKKLGA